MATRVAVIGGTFIRPGVSKNGRLYTAENIGKAVGRMQTAAVNGELPLSMYTSHGTAFKDDALAQIGKITHVEQMPDGSARFEADIADTTAGKDIANLAIGKYIKGVSIRGMWGSDPYETDDGHMTADDLIIRGVDFTNSPGVEGAEIDFAALAESFSGHDADGKSGLIFESVDDAEIVEVLELDAGITLNREAAENLVRAASALAEALDFDLDADLSEASKSPYGSVNYADPGYQSDGVKRYPIDTAAHVRAAWSYINQSKNAGKYTSQQVGRIKGKIKSAAKKFNINIQSESEALTRDIQDILEAYASSSWDNGQGSGSVSGYTNEPGDLPKVAQRVAMAAMAALSALDPDQDGDIDLEDFSSSQEEAGAQGDPDDSMSGGATCAVCNASMPSDAMYCPTCGVAVPGAESTGDSSDPLDNNKELHVSTETTETSATESEVETSATERTIPEADVQAMIQSAVEAALAANRAADEAAAAEAAAAAAEAEVITTEETTETQETEVESTFTHAQVQEMIEAAASKAVEEARAAAVDGFRNNPTRKGMVTTEAGDVEVELTNETLADLNSREWEKVQEEFWNKTAFFTRKREQLAQRAGLNAF